MFFLRYGKVDTLTVLAPISIILCILQIVAWGLDVFIFVLLIISILDFCTNFRALLRFVSGLYVDHYSIAFKIGAFLVLILAVAEALTILLFFPKNVKASSYDVIQTKVPLHGTFARGFEKANYFERADGVIYIFEPKKKEIDKKQSIILISDKRSDTYGYLPYIYSLSKIGYTVYSADFYAKDLTWFNSIADSRYFRKEAMLMGALSNKNQFESQKEYFNYNAMRECEAVFKFAKERDIKRNAEGNFEPVILIGDWMSEIAVQDFKKLHPEEVALAFKLADYPQYKTVGYGFVNQMNPFMAHLLGQKRTKDIYAPSYLAMETVEAIPARKYPDLEPEEPAKPENEIVVTIKEGELE